MPPLFLLTVVVGLSLSLVACSSGPTQEEIRAMVKAEVVAALVEIKQGPQGLPGERGPTGQQGPVGTVTLSARDEARLKTLESALADLKNDFVKVSALYPGPYKSLHLGQLHTCLDDLEDAVKDVSFWSHNHRISSFSSYTSDESGPFLGIISCSSVVGP